MTWKRVVIPTDFSPSSLAAIKYAAKLIDPKSTEVILVSVVEPIAYANLGYGYGVADLGAVLVAQERAAQLHLKRLVQQWRKRLPKVRAVRLTGSAATSIVAAAKKLKADAIVIATHGRTGLPHFFLGSVAERVVRTAGCPVLTVRTNVAAKRPTVKKPPKRAAIDRAA